MHVCSIWQQTTTTIVLWPFVRDYLDELVPEETFTHPPSWSSCNVYQLLPSDRQRWCEHNSRLLKTVGDWKFQNWTCLIFSVASRRPYEQNSDILSAILSSSISNDLIHSRLQFQGYNMEQIAFSLCFECALRWNDVHWTEQHQASVAANNMYIYIYCSSTSIVPQPLVHDLFFIAEFLVLGSVLELTLSSAAVKSGLPTISDLLQHPWVAARLFDVKLPLCCPSSVTWTSTLFVQLYLI